MENFSEESKKVQQKQKTRLSPNWRDRERYFLLLHSGKSSMQHTEDPREEWNREIFK